MSSERSTPVSTYLDDFIATVDQRGDEVAVCSAEAELTYAELHQEVVALASYLRSVLPDENSLVGICLPRTPSLIVSMLAVQMAGFAYVPIDPAFPEQRIRLILEDAGVEVLLGSEQVTLTDIPNKIKLIHLEKLAGDIDKHKTAELQQEVENALHAKSAERLAYVIYTSGSTGRPKGVCVSMENLTNFLRSMREYPGIDKDDRVLALTTVAFDIAQLELFLPLITGARVHIAPRETAMDGAALAELIDSKQISLVQATPSTWRLLKLADWRGDSGLTALTGGEPINSELAGWIAGRVKTLWNMYGPTETTVWSTCCQITSEDIASGKIPVGQAIANTSLYVRQAESELQGARYEQVSTPGETGELLIGGLGVARGYHQRSELTAAGFIANPFVDELKATDKSRSGSTDYETEKLLLDPVLYCTGDLVSFDEQGRYYCHGRIDSQLKLRGYRIEPGEIESVLESIESIERAAVCLQQYQGGDFLAAYLVISANDEILLERIEDQLSRQLPEYMMPRLFVSIDSMPQTPNAKLDRAALPEPGLHGSVILSRANQADTSLTSAQDSQSAVQLSATEKKVASMWAELTGQTVIDRSSNFFEIGGHSLLAMRFITAARQEFTCSLPFRSMASNTLAEIAERLESGGNAHAAGDQLLTSRSGGFIHTGKRRVFYQIHVPNKEQIKGSVLIVPPIAHEHARIYRELFVLAEKLARQGYCVLRFDFSGTGHSALSSSELLLDDWFCDIHDAGARLSEATGHKEFDVIAVRAGGLLLAHAGLSSLGRKIVWDPVFSGAEHVELLRRLTTAATSDLDRYRWSVKEVPTDEIMGQIYQPQLLSNLSALQWPHAGDFSSGDRLHLLGGSSSIELPEVASVAGSTPRLSVSMGQLHRVQDVIDWNDPKQVDSIIVASATLDAITDLLQ